MNGANEPSNKQEYNRMVAAVGQSIPNEKGNIKMPPDASNYGPTRMEVVENEGIIISASSNHIDMESGKRIDDKNGAVLENLEENEINQIVAREKNRAKMTGNDSLLQKLQTITENRKKVQNENLR